MPQFYFKSTKVWSPSDPPPFFVLLFEDHVWCSLVPNSGFLGPRAVTWTNIYGFRWQKNRAHCKIPSIQKSLSQMTYLIPLVSLGFNHTSRGDLPHARCSELGWKATGIALVKTEKRYFDKAAYFLFLTGCPADCRYFLFPLRPFLGDKATCLLLSSLWHL